MFAKEGYPFIITFAAITLVVLILPKYLLVFISILLLALMVWFFRDPERITPNIDDAIVSAADGRVVEISEVTIENIKFKKISVFMNVLNVHVNRAPFGGTVSAINHIEGTFLPADKPEASTQNERCEIHFDTKHGRMIAVQVAGLVARRTVAYVEEDSAVAKGDRIGMIKFSSRVDHYLPLNVKVEVQEGSKVLAGITTIATI